MEVIIIKIVLAVIFTLSVIGKLAGKTKSTFENAGYQPYNNVCHCYCRNNTYSWIVYKV